DQRLSPRCVRALADEARLATRRAPPGAVPGGRHLRAGHRAPSRQPEKESPMSDFDVIVKDGMVIDGTQSQRYRADVGIRDGRVAAIGRLRGSDARRVLDATGMIV